MTDIRDTGLIRETLFTTVPAGTLAELVREVLLATVTAGITAGIVREVLLADPVAGAAPARQYAVTVIT